MKNAIIFDLSGTLVKMRPPTLLVNKNMLNNLSKKYLLIIITGAKKTETYNILSKLGIIKYFDLIITKDDTPNKKPSTKLFKYAKRELKFKKSLYIGDTTSDYIFAQNSKIPFYYVGVRKLGIKNNTNINILLTYLMKKFPDKIIL